MCTDNTLKKIVQLLVCFWSVVGVEYYWRISGIETGFANSILSLIVFFAAYVLVRYVKKEHNIRNIYVGGALGICFAMILLVGGHIEGTGGYCFEMLKKDIFYLPGLAMFLGCIVILFYSKISTINMGQPMQNKVSLKQEWCIIFCSWSIVWLIFLPGTFHNDVPWQLRQFINGTFSEHHPLIHTLYLGLCIKTGLLLGSATLGALIYSLSQMIIMSFIFAYTIKVCVNVLRISLGGYWAILLFYAIYPLNIFYSFTATKDILFSGMVLLSLDFAIQMIILPKEQMPKRIYIKFVFSVAFMLLLRNNAIYAAILSIPFWIYRYRKNYKKAILITGMIFFLFFCVSTGMRNLCNANKGGIQEMLSIPAQQIARALNENGVEISQNEKNIIYEIIPEEKIEEYNPVLADPVKNAINTKKLKENPKRYINVYLSIGKKSISAYVNAFLEQNLAYWYPYREYGGSFAYMSFGVRDDHPEFYDFSIEEITLLPKLREKIIQYFRNCQFEEIPVFSLLLNRGFICWGFFLEICYLAFCKRDRSNLWIPFVFLFFLWMSFLLGPLVDGRYLYPIIVSIPLMASCMCCKNSN